MCGIAGVSLRRSEPSESFLRRLARLQAHRGPDGEGLYRHRCTALVHRRLSILDLEGGAQPIGTEDGKTHIVANGEIYNYRPLQDRIRDWGIRLATDSDSEVPLHLWRRHGADFVRHLEGMYALAVYDEASEELVLARDPVGIKPLYIAQTAEGIAFASEAGALVRAGWVAAAVEDRAWPSFFNKQYVDGPLTMFKGVEKVRPGEVIRIRRGEIHDRRVYPLALQPAAALGEVEALERLDDLGTRTVESHLQSDVPYGAFLSGGIDSSFVVTKMAELVGNVRTYSIGFSSDTVSDERDSALRLSRKLGTRHQAIEFTPDDFWRFLPRMCESMDDLIADYAALPTLKLAEFARNEVKVILSGEGGDEGFAGYRYYRRSQRSLWRRLLRPGRRPRTRRSGNAAGYGDLFRSAEVSQWHDAAGPDRFDIRGFTDLQVLQARDIGDWLPDDLMTKVDRCLMAHGIEGRVPLLDRELLGFAFALPDRLKLSGPHQKYLLRRWIAEHQPQQEPWAKKRGFTVPIGAWLEARRAELRSYLPGHPGVGEVMVPDHLEDWLGAPLEGRGAKLLFNVLCYALWHDTYIRGVPTPAYVVEPRETSVGR